MKDPIPHLGNPDDQSLKKYIVTLKNFDDSTVFYDHMETDVTGIDNVLPAVKSKFLFYKKFNKEFITFSDININKIYIIHIKFY